MRCIHCQYNLRTLYPDSRCPECGNAVADSLKHYQTHAGALEQPGVLRAGAFCFAVLCFLALPVHLGFGALERTALPPQMRSLLQILTHLAFVALLSLGTLLINSALGRTVLHSAIRGLLSMVAVGYAASALLSSLGLAAMLFSRRQRGAVFRLRIVDYLLRDQRLFTALVVTILSLIGYFIMRQLAKSLASPQLERMSRLAFAGLAVSSLFCLGTYLLLGIYRRMPGPLALEPIFSALDACMGVMGVFLGCYWVYVARLIGGHVGKTHVVQPLMPPAEPAPAAEQKIARFLGATTAKAAP